LTWPQVEEFEVAIGDRASNDPLAMRDIAHS
jgi:hypothetical protein